MTTFFFKKEIGLMDREAHNFLFHVTLIPKQKSRGLQEFEKWKFPARSRTPEFGTAAGGRPTLRCSGVCF